jgi:hypothetical protein
MADFEPDDDHGDDELEISALRPWSVDSEGGRALGYRLSKLSPLDAHVGQQLALALGVGLVLAAVLSALPQVGDMLGTSKSVAGTSLQASLPTSGSGWTIRSSSSELISATPEATSDLQPQLVPALGPAPATFGEGQLPTMTHVGPPALNEAIGRARVWISGFSGTYPTLALGPDAQAKGFGWDAPYTEYGWPAPIILAVQSGFREPVLLSGWDANGRNLQLGFVVAGAWGAPDHVSATFLLDPAHPSVPAGGSDNTGVFWYGYIFVPAAGCYTLNAAWPDGSWPVAVSAGLPR